MNRAVTIAAGQVGARAVIALRERGLAGSITLIGDEPHALYERPPLSKDVLLGRSTPRDALVNTPMAYQTADIELMLNQSVEAVDLRAAAVLLAGGRALGFDELIVATGVRSRPISRIGVEARDKQRIADDGSDRLELMMLQV